MITKNLLFLSSCASLAAVSCSTQQAAEPKPNILWVMIEDWSTDLSCYGTAGVQTPNIDKLASEGVIYMNAYTTAPVSSASRSAMMSGYYQNFVHGNQHRLPADEKQPLPYNIKTVPALMAEAGYHTHLACWKTDVNFLPATKSELFEDTRDWSKRDKTKPFFAEDVKDGKPFFIRTTFDGTHRKWDRDPVRPIDPQDVEIPPYYADTDFIRRDWANGLEQMQIVDRQFGEMMAQLEAEGFADNTIVIFLADNGRCHFRGKQFLYEPGCKVPMIIRYPGHIKPGTVNSDLVSAIDICKTVLDIAGVEPEIPLHGLNLLNGDTAAREYIFTARDKMDDTHDAMRAVRSKDGFKLIHNLMPERPYMQYNQYKEGGYPPIAEMSYLYLKGELNEAQSLFFAATKPIYELYDLNTDPYEIHNLADEKRYAAKKEELLEVLNDWRENVIKDEGVSEEFRALNVFPATNPEVSVDLFVHKNGDKYDYNKVGMPAWYPTRSMEEWRQIRDAWKEYIYREPGTSVDRPEIILDYGKRK